MSSWNRKMLWMPLMGGLAAAMGCASSAPPMNAELAELQAQLSAKENQVSSLQGDLSKSQQQIATLNNQLESARAPVSAPPPSRPAGGDLFPPNAKPGECYTRTFVPPRYETKTETVLTRAASERIDVAPATFTNAEERVLVRAASSRIEVIPAEYGWDEERVLVKPASKKLVEVPAEYGWEEETILVKPAHTIWKKGRGPIERVDDSTGEIMCLVEVPAQYETVRKRVVTKPATTREIEIPAEYKTVRKRVVTKPPTTRTIEIPAEYKTVKVRKQVTPPTEKRIEIPAQYGEVTKRALVADGHMAWREILCETNINPGVVTSLQRALRTAGHDPGPIDGVVGSLTLSAVRSYQQAKRLPTGGLTIATLESLGINPR